MSSSSATPHNTPKIKLKIKPKKDVPAIEVQPVFIPVLSLPSSAYIKPEESPEIKSFYAQHSKEDQLLKRLAVRQFYYYALQDLPFTESMIHDYGMHTLEHENVVRRAVKNGLVPIEVWELYCGNGPELTRILKPATQTLLEFHTGFDYIARRRPLKVIDVLMEKRSKQTLQTFGVSS